MSIWLGNQRLDSGIAHNIGDIFYTARTDEALAGAVECNGGTYDTRDYTGAGSIGELLAAGKLDYISLSEYATAISTKGWCDKIGWDGGTTVRVPTLTPHIIQKNNIPVVGNNMPIYMKNELTSPDAKLTSVNVNPYGLKISGTGGQHENSYLSTDGTKSGIIADTTDTAQLRVMFQLFNGTTDEAVATVGTVVAQVGELNSHRVISFQVPTAGNGWTWYRKYADGWVEQGGNVTIQAQQSNTGKTTPVSLPIAMQNQAYGVTVTFITDGGNTIGLRNHMNGRGVSTLTIGTYSTTGITNAYTAYWEVKGMAQ